MIKIGIFDKDKIEAVKELLLSLITNQLIDILDALNQPSDILIVNKIPPENDISPEHLSTKIVIANSDDRHVLQFVSSINAQIITYGLNSKAAVTASSHVDDDCYVICVQRAMATIFDTPILPREFSISIKGRKGFDGSIMGAVATALICGVNFE